MLSHPPCHHHGLSELVPKLHPAKGNFTSFAFSEKSWVYFLALQLWFSEGTSSFLGE
jgi:hypothetical protein